MENKLFSLIEGHIKIVKQISFTDIAKAVKDGTINGISFKQAILKLRGPETSQEEKGKLKKSLIAFTPAGTFSERRTNNHISEYSQIIGLDFDKIDDIDALRKSVNKDSHTLMSFVSPSGNGLKVFVRTNAEQARHQDAFKQVYEYYNELTGVESDPSVKDLARLCYFSFDEDVFTNPNNTVFSIEEAKVVEDKSTTDDIAVSAISNELKQSSNKDFDALVEYTNVKGKYVQGNRNNYIHLLACNANRIGFSLGLLKELVAANFAHEDPTELGITINSAYQNNVTDFDTKILDNNRMSEKPKEFGVSAKHLLDLNIVKLEYLVESLVRKGVIHALAGSSDTGKSTFLRQLATSIALGKDDFLGFSIQTTNNKVLYVSTEDDLYSIAYLLKKQNPETGEEESLLFKNLRYVFDSDDLIDNLNKHLSKNDTDIVVIDAFSDIYTKDMNMASSIRPFLNQFSQLAQKFNVAFIFLHHTGKRTEHLTPSKNNILGSQAFEAKTRLTMVLRKDRENPSLRHLCIVKGNLLSEDMKNESFVLRFDENMVFHNTGSRVPFEELGGNADGNADWKAEAKRLKTEECKTVAEIHQILSRQGCQVGRSTIGNWVRGLKCQQEDANA